MIIDRLTVLGSGTIVPAKNHGCAGYVIGGDSSPVLLDCGPGTLYRLTEAGISPESIELVFVSHFHLDHVSDLPAFLNARSILLGDEGQSRIQIVGPKGLRDHFAWLSERMDPWFSECRFELTELGDEVQTFHGLRVRSCPTGHTGNSLSFRIDDSGGRVLFYSGDTDYNERLIPFAQSADLAIFECSMPDSLKLHGHLTPRLAATLARMAEVKQLLLTHFYREILDSDILGEAKRVYDGPIYLAVDLNSYPIALPST